MTSMWSRIRRNLLRPLPELWHYILAKVVSRVWSAYLGGAGPGLHISRGARIQGGRGIWIGDRFFAGRFLWLEAVHAYREFRYSPKITIGCDVVFSDFVHIASTTLVRIGDGVLLGSRVHVTDHSHGVYSGENQDPPDDPPAWRGLSEGRSVHIQSNVWLGDGVVVLPGVTIGEGTIVGANSVVSRSLPRHVIAVGSPAVPIKAYDESRAAWVPLVSGR